MIVLIAVAVLTGAMRMAWSLRSSASVPAGPDDDDGPEAGMAGDAHEQLEAGRRLRLDEGTSNAAIEPSDQVCVGPAGGLSVGDVERDCALVALVEHSLRCRP